MLRRGRPTANANWGNAPSVLVGDFIYSRSFQMLVALGDMNIMQLLSDTTNQIAEGEVLQLTKAGDSATSEAEYLRVITDKTAILFAAAVKGAAILAGKDETIQQAMHDYGLALGIAFQVADDILDYQGDAKEMGKNVGDDLNEGKPTLPLIYSIANNQNGEADIIVKAIEEKSVEQLSAIIEVVQTNGAIEYTKQFAEQYVAKAKQALEPLEDSPFKEALENLAEIALNRTA
jgi:octaprenyl-diphosphate synthase